MRKRNRNAKPKHHGAIALTLAGVFVTAGVAICAIATAGADDIAISETVFYGDAATVAGVTLTQYTTMNNQLIWETTTPLADPSAAETTLTQSRNQRYNSEVDSYFNVNFSLNASSTTSSQFYFTEDGAASWISYSAYPLAMYQDVASRVAANSTYSETVNVAEYGDYYLPRIYIQFPSESSSDSDAYCTAEATAALQEYLKQPIGAEDTVNVAMTADADGGVYSMSATFVSDNASALDYSCGVFYDDNTVYFARMAGKNVELHQLVFAPDEDEKDEMQLVSAALVYTIEHATLTGNMLSIRDGHLFVSAGEDSIEAFYIFAINGADASDTPAVTLTQTLPTGDITVWDITHYDDFFVLTENDGTFAIYEAEGAGDDGAAETAIYTQVLAGNYAAYLTLPYDAVYYQPTMAYEDGVLITTLHNSSYTYRDDLTTYLTVNTAEGCTFAAAYGSSLAQDATEDGNYTLRNWSDSAVEISM